MPSPHPTLTYLVADEWTEPSSQIVMDGLLAYNATFYDAPKEKKLAISAMSASATQFLELLTITLSLTNASSCRNNSG
jgi:hypothetical protein